MTPASGPLGTTFQIHAKLNPQEKVAIEIDLPNGKTFTGQAHTAAADGAVNTVYRTTMTDPAGTFQVKATGDHGDQSIGHFTATLAGAAATTKARATSTTVHGPTTTIRGTTTTIRPSTPTTKHA